MAVRVRYTDGSEIVYVEATAYRRDIPSGRLIITALGFPEDEVIAEPEITPDMATAEVVL